jgi:hypothetical protein
MNLVTIYDIQNKFVGMFVACVFLLYIVNFKELEDFIRFNFVFQQHFQALYLG